MTGSRSRAPVGVAFALVAWSLLAWSLPASAQTPNERALAESLFRDGKDLMAKGDYPAACRKLEESYRLDAVGGTLLNLATCHEKEGKVTTAWAEYQSALELAKRANRRDRIALAQKKVDELAKQVARITIQIAGETPPGLVVELDGVALGAGSMGAGLAVDPGDHHITARADGRQPFASTVTVTAGESTILAIPELSAVAKEPAAPPPPPAEAPRGAWMRPTSYVLGGVAAVGLAIGAGAGIAALGNASDAEAGCNDGLCNADAFAAHEDGRDAATISNVGFVIGLLAGASAVTLFILSPGDGDDAKPSEAATLTPIVGTTALGGVVRVPLSR